MEITTESSVPLESENNKKFILTLQGDSIKFSQAYAMLNHEAQTVAEKFIQNFI